MFTQKASVTVPADLPFSQPYWLRQPGTVGTYAVSDQTLIGRPENPPALPVEITLQVGDQTITYSVPPRFRKVDRVAGEVSEPLVIAPPAFAELPRPVFVFGKADSKTVNVRVDFRIGEVLRQHRACRFLPAGKSSPFRSRCNWTGWIARRTARFQVTPPAAESEGILRVVFMSEGRRTDAYSRERIDYPHIEPQTLISPAQAKLVRANIENMAQVRWLHPGRGRRDPGKPARDRLGREDPRRRGDQGIRTSPGSTPSCSGSAPTTFIRNGSARGIRSCSLTRNKAVSSSCSTTPRRVPSLTSCRIR